MLLSYIPANQCTVLHSKLYYFFYNVEPVFVCVPGKGRGRQVIAVARTADLVLMMLDSGKGDIQRKLLEKELEAVGIRLNNKPPNIYFKVGREEGRRGWGLEKDEMRCDRVLRG